MNGFLAMTHPADKQATLTAHGWPIKVSIATVVVSAMVLLAAVILSLGWRDVRLSLLGTAGLKAHDAGQLITEKARRLLEPSQATLRQLAFDSIADAKTLDQRIARLHVMADELTANELVASVFVGYADGSFLLIRPLEQLDMRTRFEAPPRANFMVQSRTRNKAGKLESEFLYFNAQNKLLSRHSKPEYDFDPRTRGWYQSALTTSYSVLSPPYAFFTTRQVGLTLSQASRSGGAVFGIDVVLDDLSASLGKMRMTANTQLALVNDKDEVLAYPDMQRVLIDQGNSFAFKTVHQLDNPYLKELVAANPNEGQAEVFQAGNEEMLGVILPFNVWQGQGMRLLVVAPVDELLGPLKAQRMKLIWLVLGLVAVMLPMGWFAGAAVGRSLDRLSVFAQCIARFDFANLRPVPTFVREVNQLSGVMTDMSQTIQNFLMLSQKMATEPQVERMLDEVLTQLVVATRCNAGAVYLWNAESEAMQLVAEEGASVAQFLPEFAYLSSRSSRTGPRPIDPSLSQMEVELRGRSGQLQGLLVLAHQVDGQHTDPAFLDFTHKLSGMLAVSIETRQLMDAQKKLLEAIIRLMADAIDAKSPYTGGHCERVPQLATMMVDRMTADTQGPYQSFSLSEEERYEFHLGAWLHDCGKVTSPEYIVDKATKLEVIYNRIHEVRTRFEVLWRDADIAHLQRLAAGSDAAGSQATLEQQHQQLQSDFAFVAQCNVGSEFMAEESLARLTAISTKTWQRNFDNRLGLAPEEASRFPRDRPQDALLPVTEFLLANRPEHIVPWGERKPAVEKGDPRNIHGFDMKLPATQQNMGELYNLSINRGTLTAEDRFKINDHIVQTYTMLKGLPWPAQLARVPEIAATHHEKLDGQGYPRKLPAERLTVLDRVMSIVDVFEALTAADRPYKAPKTLDESFRIMAQMCSKQHLDTELFRYFLHSGLWRTFADGFMKPEQCGEVDVAAIEKLLPASPPAAVAQPA